MLLMINDGHGVPSAMYGFDLVTVTSGAAEGQSVPQGARTVDCEVLARFATIRSSSTYLRLSTCNGSERESEGRESHV